MVDLQAKKRKGAKIRSMSAWLDKSWSEGRGGQPSNPDEILKKMYSCSIFNNLVSYIFQYKSIIIGPLLLCFIYGESIIPNQTRKCVSDILWSTVDIWYCVKLK